MTPTPPQPHPYRCETCAHHIFQKGMKHPHSCSHPIAQSDNYIGLKSLVLADYERIQFMGCCSHSQHQGAEQPFTDRELDVIALALPKLDIYDPNFCDGHTDEETLEILEKICKIKDGKYISAEQRIADVIKELRPIYGLYEKDLIDKQLDKAIALLREGK